MKKILKSFVTIAAVLAVATGSTQAWFTSNVAANDNLITTGNFQMAVYSTDAHTYGTPTLGAKGSEDVYMVAQEVNNVWNPGSTLEEWTVAMPGMYDVYNNAGANHTWPREDGNYSVWVAWRNTGTIPMKVAGYANGEWTSVPHGTFDYTLSGGPDCTGIALDGTGSDNTIIVPQAMHFYASSGTGTANCESHEECRNIRDALFADTTAVYAAGVPSTDVAGPLAGIVYGSNDGTSTGVPFELEADEFIIARLDMFFDGDNVNATSCYEEATYNYDLISTGYQANQPW